MYEPFIEKEYNFMKYRWWFLAASGILMLLCTFLLVTKGLNYGTDFKGGLKLIYQFKVATGESEITEALSGKGFPGLLVQRFGEADQNTFVIKSDLPEENATDELTKPFSETLVAKYGADQVLMIKEEFVGPKVGRELRNKGIYAVVWAWVIMLIYIGFRFDFYFAPGAIVALIHDVIIALGAFALTQREVNLTVVAGFLTIVGYSINDTIIVFDRIRENIKRHKGTPLVSIINKSLTQTLMRTIITSLTVFFVVLVLFLRAEGDIQNFAFAMMWGVIAGTYSSVSIAAPIFLLLREHGHRIGIKPKDTRVVSR